MKKTIAYFILAFALSSCVSESEHQRTLEEKNALEAENQSLKNELDEIKFGAPNLLSDGKKFYHAKDFAQAKQKFQTLIEKHPDLPQSIEAKKILATIDEEELWNNAATLEDINYSENYISKYPKGKYISYAISRNKELKKLNMQKAYDNAASSNSSSAWKKFIEDYPDFGDASSIKEKIIRLEVDEISGDRETGQMPSFNNYSTGYSANSTVEITNNTGCTLTVRYSGPEARIIEIPSGGTQSVYLSSGNYKIAASACGSNYAGTESLHGSYGSTFYITTSR